MEKLLNCIGLACPIPVVKTRKALEEFTEDGLLTVLADNETCVQNLTRLAGSLNLPIASEQTGEKEYTVKITVSTEAVKAGAGTEVQVDSCEVPSRRGATIVVASNKMGDGEEKLGKALMKAFLFALTNTPDVPETMLFYNSGAYLTCEGSDSLEDLKHLAEAGTKIFTCGTCLNFYGITEKLQVGEVTNMYDIVDMQQKAAKIIRP
ncbi:MAG: sulfurtransferase-like selenium metabolism protein YedF [Lachnospiraceae bacterium]|nr:sulfurtransferase-like selenium metabolism protein YedF [Lachnospiraceae bacterium]